MATTWTQEDLTRIERAIRSGARRITYADGRSVEYRSLEDLFTVREEIEKALGLSTRPLRKVAAHSKGVQAGGFDRSEWWGRRC